MIKELQAKTMLHYHERTFATNWDANIYRGCEHNCRYCFAQYSHKYLENEEFFTNIFVKSNAAEILSVELARKKWGKHPVCVCGISDCYQPAEAKYKIMPGVIKSFIANRNPLVITTKSTLILRDMDLLRELNRVAELSIGTSVSTLDEEKRKRIEPNSAPTIERLKMLLEFSRIGCNTSVLFMPIIPYISDDDENLDDIFRITKQNNLGSINAWPLHLRGKTKGVFYTFLGEHFPDLLPKYRLLYKYGNVSTEYRLMILQKIRALRNKYQLYTQYKPALPKSKGYIQRSLFE